MRRPAITSGSGASRRPRRAAVVLLLIVVGVVAAVSGAVHWDHQFPTSKMQLQGERLQIVGEELVVLGQGAPPLVRATVPYKQAVQTHQVSPADSDDDPGIYLYLPVAGHLVGDNNPVSLVKWFFIGLMSLVLLMYPLVFYFLFDSLVVALAAPLAVLIGAGFLLNQDIYVIQAWAVLCLLPIVLLAAKLPWRRRSSIELLALAALGASFANSVRGHAGTGVVVAAIAVVLMRERTWRGRAAAAGVVAACYLLINPLAFDAIRTYSYHEAHIQSTTASMHGHPFWHPMYLGLGVLPNKWGIQWRDSFASETVTKADPKAVYLSAEYERTLRGIYFNLVENDPLYAIRLYATKAAVAIQYAASRFWLALMLAPLVLAVGAQRRRMQRNALLVLPALCFGLLPPLVGVPNPNYSDGFAAALGLLALLASCSVFVLLRDAVLDFDRSYLRALVEGWRTWRVAVLVAVASTLAILGVGLAAAATTTSTATERFYQLGASLLEPAPTASTSVKRWDGRALAQWIYRDASPHLLPGGALAVQSRRAHRNPQMASGKLRLQRGTYVVLADGIPERGGLEFAAWNPAQQALLSHDYYWSGQVGFSSKHMQTQFSLTQSATIQLLVADWEPQLTLSRWLLHSVEIVRLPTP
jgi:hypothetical protein